MGGPQSARRDATHIDDVVGVEVTIDGMLVIADRLGQSEFPTALGIRLNIPQPELRDIVWEQVARDLTAQGVLDVFGEPHPEVAAMVDTLSRSDRTLEARWWRRDVGGKMIRFVVCRKGDRHVVAARDGDMLVLQRVAPQVGLAGMVNTVLGLRQRCRCGTADRRRQQTGGMPRRKPAPEVRRRADLGACLRRHHRGPRQLGGDHRGRTPSRRHLHPGRCRGRSARLPARPHRVDTSAGERRAVRKLPARAARRTSSARSTDWSSSCRQAPGSTRPQPTSRRQRI